MAFQRGDIVSLDFEMPHSGNYVNHPAVILSGAEVYDGDRCYVCVMMTTSPLDDIFTFVLKPEMVEKPFIKPDSQVRCHLITYVREVHIDQINSPINRLKPKTLYRLLSHINSAVFDYK